MLKWFKIILLVVVLAVGGLVAYAWTPDIPHQDLVAKYGTGASNFVTLPSGAVAHYRDQGNKAGPVIVLLHGSNASLHTWEPWVRELKGAYRIITVDEPGHGLTGATPADDYTYDGMVAFVNEFTESLSLDRFFLGGNSMGGGVSLAYAVKYPEDLRGLILVDAAGTPVPEEAMAKVDRPAAFNLAGKWYASWILENITPRSLVIEGLTKTVADPTIIDDAMIDRYWDLARHPGNRRATGIRFAWYRDAKPTVNVDHIAMPTLILWGEKDSLIPVEVGYALQKRIRDSELVVYPNVGHIPMEEIPAISASAVNSFIERVLGPEEIPGDTVVAQATFTR
ncbi:MAG: alpha/beta hydrolase [Alphaproteobacteria bacterium]|nr:MAG: alpha/beta hydrolase [Alphaproteobacteria bacterium]